jgi:uncharacterized repeat protein (TIGR01451 family)
MSKKGLSIGALVLAVVLGIAGFAAFRSAQADSVGASANLFAIDAVSGGSVQNVVNVPVGGTFQFDVNLVSVVDPYQAFQSRVAYDPTILGNPVGPVGGSQILGSATLCGGGTVDPVGPPATLYDGCARISGTQSNTGVTDVWQLDCLAPGSTVLHLQTDAEAGALGTDFGGTANGEMSATTHDATVNCVLGVNKTDNVSGVATAGGQVTYSITVDNPLGNPGDSFTGVIVDTIPTNGTATFSYASDSLGNSCDAVSTPGVVTCITNFVNPSTTVQITFDVPLSAAGQNAICDTATTYNLSSEQTGALSQDCVNVAPAVLTASKSAGATSYQAGDPITWTVTVNSTGASPAGGVVVTDTAADGFDITTVTNSANCTQGAVSAGSATWNCGNLSSTDGAQVLTVNGTVHDPNPADNSCNNSVAVTSTNGASANASAQTQCLSKNVRMVKSTDCDNAPQNSGENANLFLDNGGNKANPLASLTICEWALNVGGDPQGVGAFEFDVSYDNRVFDIAVAGSPWLYATGRVADATNSTDPAAGCAATVITENDVRFGCVSKNPQPLAGPATCLGPDVVSPVTGAVCGNKADGVIATITVTPKADLLSRITPGNDNGVIRTLVDSGCEYADIWGHPLETAGNGATLPGIQPGGQVTDCSNLTVTVRILEGDMNTDCTVDVTDDQMEAAHYAATFGSLLYDPWYDLEPALKDGDVDIKDLQKVFGRNGSDCASPVPPQPAQPQPGDP